MNFRYRDISEKTSRLHYNVFRDHSLLTLST